MNRYSGDTQQTVVCKLIKEEDLNDKAREKAREEVLRMRKARRAVTFAAFIFGDTARSAFAGSWCGVQKKRSLKSPRTPNHPVSLRSPSLRRRGIS